MQIKMDGKDLRRINRARAELQKVEAGLQSLYCDMEDKYDFCIQFDTVNLQSGIIEKVGGKDANN